MSNEDIDSIAEHIDITGVEAERIEMVQEFMDKFNIKPSPELWAKLVDEETREVLSSEGPVDLLKELADLEYVSCGWLLSCHKSKYSPSDLPKQNALWFARAMAASELCDAFQQDYPHVDMDEAFRRVHSSNMSKLGRDGKPIYRHDGKVMKGPDYKPPVLDDLFITTETKH